MSGEIASYEEVFNVEIDGWCYGIENYPGEIYPNLVHLVVREMKPLFIGALERGVVFDLVDISIKVSKSAKNLVHDQEILFSILVQLPVPSALPEEAQYTFAQILDKADQKHEGLISKMEARWESLKKKQAA